MAFPRCGIPLPRTISLVCILLTCSPAWADVDFLSIKFSKKSQLRTSMRWMQHQPKLISAEYRSPRVVGHEDTMLASGSASGPSTPKAKALVPLYEQMPYVAVGKLFFTKKNGNISTCTTSFAGAGDLIVTAAHCVVAADGEWNEDFLFIRSYGSENQETYAVSCASVVSLWGSLQGDAAMKYDYAFMQTARQNKPGSLAVVSATPPEEVMLVGYADKYFNGRYMLSLEVPTFEGRPGHYGSKNNPLGSGSSGMPWLGSNTVFSLTSHFRAKEENIMWGPQFTADTLALMSYARNGCERG